MFLLANEVRCGSMTWNCFICYKDIQIDDQDRVLTQK